MVRCRLSRGITDTANSHSGTFNQMWVKEDEWIDSLQWQEDEARDEFPNLRIPLEIEGADILYSVIAPEPKFRTQLIYQAAAIFHEREDAVVAFKDALELFKEHHEGHRSLAPWPPVQQCAEAA